MSSQKLIDVSRPLAPQTPVWPDDDPIDVRVGKRIADGGSSNVTRLDIGTHTGTHIDAPWHFIDDGPRTDSIDLQRLLGPSWVVDLTDKTDHLTAEDFDSANIPEGTTRLLLKTANSQIWHGAPFEFQEDYIGITTDGAEWLVNNGIDVIGIDYLSVEPYESDGATHRIILGAKLIILETIDLTDVEEGAYYLYCLPLRVDEVDGAPCRVVLEPQK